MSKDVDDPLLDHNYDGIQEYDNPLPGWWKLLFWASIVLCVPYTIYYHVMDGHSILDRFELDMKANVVSLNLTADGATILALRNDPEKLELVKGKFQTLCAACHRPDGTGMPALGPNLTDKYWKNVKSLTDIHRVLTNGVPGTAMVAQVSNLNKDELVLMSAYVASLSLNPKAGKEPEGEEVPAWPEEAQSKGSE
ncbi:MAG: c-type cytochrome [Planctomycetes bacterium]|nr:c-type cytochrome [Planctomycetota bacterium]MCB9910750.1 c-type cytochrome [Planctomycetota bacterium]MCB9912776.1 c-type cytochrome [Planctomycetota bacterium]HPF14776.1 cbb3-type cytochrome c oxidase N-terminal domain-containing protein [Planctomycetota bacterium]